MIKRLLPSAASLLASTLRVRWTGDTLPKRAVVMFWHGKMFAGWYAVRAGDPVALVSQSKDGQLLASVMKNWRYQLVRGSSKKNGRQALQEAIEMLNSGSADRLIITPDGPRGPYHRFKRGAFIAARESGLPLFMLTIRYTSPIVFTKSWDKFELPKPFSSVKIEAIRIDTSTIPLDVEAQRPWLDSLAIKLGDGN